MLRGFTCATMLASVAIVGAPSRVHALAPETIAIDSGRASKGPFTAQLLRPSGAGPFPAIVAMHGCGGLLNDKGNLRSRETDWAERFLAAGYAVLFPDSFTARGLREICTGTSRSIFPKDRADDAAAAAEWLSRQAFIDRTRLALMGWSHGAMAVLWAVRCRQIARLDDWRPEIPLTVLIGGADDWTRPGPCRDLARRTGFRFIEYIGAFHGFDAPQSRVRVRRGLGAVEGGRAHVGTDPAARTAAIEEVMGTLRAALQGR